VGLKPAETFFLVFRLVAINVGISMPLPPKGDPRRPLHLAIRSTRVLAAIFLLFGSCAFLPLLMTGGMRGGMEVFSLISVVLFYMGPGVIYLLCSIYLQRRQFWAVLTSLILASIQLLITLAGVIAFVVLVFSQSNSSFNFTIIPIVLLLIVILALAQLIYHLTLSFEAIKHVPIDEQRGFEPILPALPPQDPQ
jgi:hypothetical protein